jgi:hypothetical protein
MLCIMPCCRYHSQLEAERAELERIHSDRLARLAAREDEVRHTQSTAPEPMQ